MLNTVRLTVTSPTKAFVHTVLEDSTIKIGRSLKCDFSIPLEDLSREHCLFEVQDKTYFITDLGSSNGVTVDRTRIEPNTRVEVTPESQVVLSNMYVLQIAPMEVKTKSDISLPASSEPKNVNRELKTVTFQLEFPDEVEKKALPKASIRKKTTWKDQVRENEGSSYEHIKMIVGFLVVAGILVYHFSKTN